MALPTACLLLAGFLSVANAAVAGAWNYEPEINKNWAAQFPKNCAGKQQSPINIEAAKAIAMKQGTARDKDSALKIDTSSSALRYYDVHNNGKTLQVNVRHELNKDDAMKISMGPLKDTYILTQFHMHWSTKNSEGSEHTLNGKATPMELHLVHYNSKYGNISEAIKHKDGLAVLGVFFKLGKENPGLKFLEPYISDVSNNEDSTTGEADAEADDLILVKSKPLPLLSLVPKTRKYWTYQGSLTTPVCSEVVTWIVLQEPLSLSASQLRLLRSLKNSDGKSLAPNFRPTLPLNGRKVKAYNGPSK